MIRNAEAYGDPRRVLMRLQAFKGLQGRSAYLMTKMLGQQAAEPVLLERQSSVHDLRIPLPQSCGAAHISHAQRQLLGRKAQELALRL